jgi:DNA replication protein DnaC
MLAICIATNQVQLGATARFVTALSLAIQVSRINTVVGRQPLVKPMLACDVLVLDELGFLPAAPAFGPALYIIIAGRHERRPPIVTSNRSQSEWASIVQDVSLAAAIVDRLMHHGQSFSLR